PVFGSTVSMVSIGPECNHDHPTGDPCPLASGRLPPVLAVEIPLAWRPTEDRRGPARADPADERGKPAVGSAAHPWRAAQARLRGRSVERREWDGPAVLPPPTTRRVGWGLEEHEEDTPCPAKQTLQSHAPLVSIPVRTRCI